MGEVKPAPSRSDGDLCPVEALAALQVLQPHRWRRPADEAPLFRYESGAGLDREGITHFIRIAALAAGFPSELAGSHSLRKGGATAFFASTGDLERLKRYGGWTSDAVHAYLYEDHTAQKGVSQGMLKSQLITLPSQKDARARDHPQVASGSGLGSELEFGLNPGEPPGHERNHRVRGSKGQRPFSWAPDRRVTFATRAGSMDCTNEDLDQGRKAAAADRQNASSCFIAQHPGLDLHDFLEYL